MSRSDDAARLGHILEAATSAVRILNGRSIAQLQDDPVAVLAIERLIGIVGEAANRLSTTALATMPEVPWRDVIDMRNFIIHSYIDVDLPTVWKTVASDLPPLIAQVERALAERPDH